MDERDHLGLRGLLPPGVETIEQQVDRCYEQFKSKRSDVEKWVFLTQLHDSNEVLFYRLVGEHVHEMLPIVYTPTVGTAIQEFSHLFRRPRGVFLNIEDVEGIEASLDATGLGADDIDLIVASDAEAILGIGDWGVGGIDISIGKLAVYTVAAGINPDRVLAVGLDVGTNQEQLLNDPRYLGLRRSRVRGEAYDAFIDAYVAAASARFPKRSCTGRTSPDLRRAGSSRATATPCAPSTTTSRARRQSGWRARWPGSASRGDGWSTRTSSSSARALPGSGSRT